MKKFCLFLVLSLWISCSLFAQKEIFKLNDNGVCEIVREVKGKDASDLYKKIKIWLKACNMRWNMMPQGDVKDKKVMFNANFNSARRYNPFAGWFEQDFYFDGYFTINGNKATLLLNNMRIRESYTGFGKNDEETQIEDKVNTYLEYKRILEKGPDPSLDKKTQKEQKKEAKDKIEDYEDVLTKSGEELTLRLAKLNEIFK